MVQNNFLIFVLLFMFTFQTNAQLRTGSLWLGGSITYYSITNKVKNVQEPQAKNNKISISPFIGKSIKEDVIVGFNLIYSGSREKYTGPPPSATNRFDYGVGVFFRKYKNLGKGFYLFANCESDYIYTKLDYITTLNPPEFQKSKINLIRLNAYPGVSYAITKSIHLEMQVGNLVTASFSDEKKHIEFPVNNKRYEHERDFFVSSALNGQFGDLFFGFRVLFNDKHVL